LKYLSNEIGQYSRWWKLILNVIFGGAYIYGLLALVYFLGGLAEGL